MTPSGRTVAASVVTAGVLAAALGAPVTIAAQAPTEAPAPDAAAPVPAPDPPAAPAPPARFIPDPVEEIAPEHREAPAPMAPVVKPSRDSEPVRGTNRGIEPAAEAVEEDEGAELPELLPGVRTVGVPRFFIDSFGVPPFLLPIYQAAGIEYGVPWEVLAAINEMESDYGRNLNVSSAGAVGWMQFLPSTFDQYGTDGNGDGRADPYNPVDAIFSAARYLRAAGAGKDLRGAIFAYNHAQWYVTGVLARARMLGGLPADLVSALSGLAQGRPPVLGPASTAARTKHTLALRTRPGAAVVAVADGEVVRIGESRRLGRFVQLRDVFGNTYTYGRLGRRAERYPALIDDSARVPVPAAGVAQDAPPTMPATAGAQSQAERPVAADVAAPARDVRAAPVQDPAAVAAAAPARAGAAIESLDAGALGPAVAAAPATSDQRGHRDAASGTGAPGAAPVGTQAPAPQPTPRPVGTQTPAAQPTPRPVGTQTPAAQPTPRPVGTQTPAPQPTRPIAAPAIPAPAAASPRAVPRLPSPLSATFPVLAATDWKAQAARLSAAVAPAATTRLTPSAPAGDALTAHDRRLLGDVSARRVRYRPLREGSRVIAGTVLAHAGSASTTSGRLAFEIRPAGRGAPRIDARPVVAGWKLLQSSARQAPLLGGGAEPTVGQVLLLGKRALQREVLDDRRIEIYECGREDIRAGRIDRRVLATLKLLAVSGLSPTVSSLQCGHSRHTSSRNVSEHATAGAVDISAINGTPILGNQGPGSITETTIRQLLALQGAARPHQIISLLAFEGAANTLAMADHDDHIHVGFAAAGGAGSLQAQGSDGILAPSAWRLLGRRLDAIDNPAVPTEPSRYARPAAKEAP